ncbi:MAG TPA: ATP-binding protein [Nocardioidaceae bacterium]|nr:ATP-binding protein [Nocardioidaceae bacterium]
MGAGTGGRALSLRLRLTALSATAAIVVLSTTAWFAYRDLGGELSDAITEELTIRVDDLAEGVQSGTTPPGAALVTAQTVNRDGVVLSPTGARPLLTADETARAAEGQIVVDRAVPEIGGDARLLARPIGGSRTDPIIGVAATSTQPVTRARERILVILAVAGPLLTAAVALAAWLVTGAALRPVRRMAGEAATITAAEAGRRLPVPRSDDEIAQLARTLNAMLDRIETAMAHERGFIDDAAHELRTPIAVLRGELELALQVRDDPEAVAEGLVSALEETDRLTRLAHDLLTLARADAGQMLTGEAHTELFAASRASVRRLPTHHGITVEVRGDATEVRGDPEWIDHIVTNLIGNACRHARSRVTVTVGAAAGSGRLEVADDGPGLPPELLDRAFDRFTRADGERGTGDGAGLGLAIVASLAHAVGGDVGVDNGRPLGGARVEVTLPIADL